MRELEGCRKIFPVRNSGCAHRHSAIEFSQLNDSQGDLRFAGIDFTPLLGDVYRFFDRFLCSGSQST